MQPANVPWSDNVAADCVMSLTWSKLRANSDVVRWASTAGANDMREAYARTGAPHETFSVLQILDEQSRI